MPTTKTVSSREVSESSTGNNGAPRRTIQVELKEPLQLLPKRAKSPSPFRFAAATGKQFSALHALANHHGLHEAHACFRVKHPGQSRRRSRAEKDHLSRFVQLHFPATARVESILRGLRRLPEVRRAVEDEGIIPANLQLDPMIGTTDQWTVVDPESGYGFQWYVYRCGAQQVWDKVSGQNVVIADIDAGFYLDHQDLAGNVERAHSFNAVDGSTDVTAGLNWTHGTAVLGIAGAAMNGVGIAGFAFNARLWPIQTDAGNGPALTTHPVANAIDWVVGENSNGRRVVINIEVQTKLKGNCEQYPAINTAIRYAISKGFVVCVAAGNGDQDAGLDKDGNAIPPTGSILVGATSYASDGNPRLASVGQGSNWGNSITVSAPGDPDCDPTCSSSGPTLYTNQLGGTSGAVAKVAGTIALMLEANPKLTHDEVKTMLDQTGSALNSDPPIGKFLNTAAAVAAAIASA